MEEEEAQEENRAGETERQSGDERSSEEDTIVFLGRSRRLLEQSEAPVQHEELAQNADSEEPTQTEDSIDERDERDEGVPLVGNEPYTPTEHELQMWSAAVHRSRNGPYLQIVDGRARDQTSDAVYSIVFYFCMLNDIMRA